MKSRLAILSMLVGALLMSMTGASLAISGISSTTNDASVAQYGGGVAPEEQTPTPAPGGGVAPEEQHHPGNTPTTPTTVAQPTRQVEAGQTTNQLPFTGFAAIPVLLAGVALLAGGLVVRRRTRAQN